MKARKVICDMCGKTFISSANVVKYCSAECSREAHRYKQREKYAKEAIKNEGLNKALEALNKYNEKHGTHLSYGQFMTLQANRG